MRSRSQACDWPERNWLISAALVPNGQCHPPRGNSADLKLFAEQRRFSSPASPACIMFSRLFRPQSALRAASSISQVWIGSIVLFFGEDGVN